MPPGAVSVCILDATLTPSRKPEATGERRETSLAWERQPGQPVAYELLAVPEFGNDDEALSEISAQVHDVAVRIGRTDIEGAQTLDDFGRLRVDPYPPLEVELALELRATAEQGSDLGRRELLVHGRGPTRQQGRQATRGT